MADLVILNGRVITFNGPDAEALAVTGGVITAVGSIAEIRDIAGSARVIDAQAPTVLPGSSTAMCTCFKVRPSLIILIFTGSMVSRPLPAPFALMPHRAPTRVFGGALDYHAMGNRSITRHDLDAACPDRAFAAITPDHHTVYANTKALEMAGLLQGREVDEGSEVVIGADGTATGELLEAAAFGPVLALTRLGGRELLGMVTGADPIPAPGAGERATDKSVIARGLEHCASYGITSLHNMDGNFYQLELLSELEADGKLLCRTEVPMHLKHTDPIDRLSEADEMRRAYASDNLWCGRVKMFQDGVIDSRTAFMLQPYPGTDSCSAPLFTPDQFKEACIRADEMGLQISVHAIGDAAVRQTLDGYEAAQQANGARDSRHRIEHIETINPADLPRIAALGVVASIQPLHSPRGGFFAPYEVGGVVHDWQIEHMFAWPNHSRNRRAGDLLDRLAGGTGRHDAERSGGGGGCRSARDLARPAPDPARDAEILHLRQCLGRIQ